MFGHQRSVVVDQTLVAVRWNPGQLKPTLCIEQLHTLGQYYTHITTDAAVGDSIPVALDRAVYFVCTSLRYTTATHTLETVTASTPDIRRLGRAGTATPKH